MNFLIVFLLLVAMQLIYFMIALKLGIVDKPNHRSSHKKETLLGGGINFYFAIMLFFIFNGFQYPWFFGGLTLLAIVSFYDDVKPMSQRIRLVVQFASLAFLFYDLHINQICCVGWYFIPILMVLAAGSLNAYNFMDGINGMTGGFNLVLMFLLWYIDYSIVDFSSGYLIIYLMFSLLIFNFFNFRTKAKCFAGDVGAFTLGFVVVFLLLQLISKTGNPAWIGLLAVYGVDTVLTIIHRVILRENIIQPHRRHLFQVLVNECGLPHLVVSAAYAIIQLIVSVGLIILIDFGYIYTPVVFLLLMMAYYIIKRKCSNRVLA
jgi:UDP-N-acetylmuramyl pentapeptide phosphotransferase/UDP-N-acetylglucosamine-1-phosphate transferase